MQIKTTMRYHLIPVRMTIINNLNKQQVLVRMWRKGNPFALLAGVQTGVATVERSMEFPQKIKNGPALWPSNSTSGSSSKETWNTNLKEHKHPYVLCSIIYNHQHMEAAQLPFSRWTDRTTMVHLHNGILLGCKKEENITFCDSMDGPGEHYAKWNKILSILINVSR